MRARAGPPRLGRDAGTLRKHDASWNDGPKPFILRQVCAPTHLAVAHLTLRRFLNAWKAGDQPSSFEHLHRYFDYTMQSRDRTFYQYALLNLAILQADFGAFADAVAAMREAVASARETRDTVCLNYALSWLYHFGKAHPQEIGQVQRSGVLGTDREALAFLKSKAKDTGMWSLLSTSFLGEAKLAQINVSAENVLRCKTIRLCMEGRESSWSV